MLQGLQQGQMYEQIPQEEYGNHMQLPTQQEMLPPQENRQIHQQERRQPPKLKHNKQIEEDEDEEIAAQNLSKEEMESIQAQLNAMQQQRQSA